MHELEKPRLNIQSRPRGGRYDQNLISVMVLGCMKAQGFHF